MSALSTLKLGTWSTHLIKLAWSLRTTLLLTLPALIVGLIPQAAEALQFDRQKLAAGQWFRLCTGHWTHWNADHAFWDILMFAVLAAVCERRSRASLLLTTGGSVVAISAALWFLAPQLATYRGLSGVDSALFALAATVFVLDALRSRQWLSAVVGLLVAAGFFGKTYFEATTGTTLFVDSDAAGFVPVPLAHAIGAMVGAAVGGCLVFRSTRWSWSQLGVSTEWRGSVEATPASLIHSSGRG